MAPEVSTTVWGAYNTPLNKWHFQRNFYEKSIDMFKGTFRPYKNVKNFDFGKKSPISYFLAKMKTDKNH